MMRKLAPYWKKCIRCPRGQRFNEFWISNIKYRQGAWSNNQLGLAKQPFKPNPKWLRRAYINFSSVASVEDSCYSWQKLSVIAPDGAGLRTRFDEPPLSPSFTSARSGAIVFVGATVLRAPALSYQRRLLRSQPSPLRASSSLCRLARLLNKITLILFTKCLLHGCG